MVEQERREPDAPQGVWPLKLAIFLASAGLFATLVDQLAASVILYLTAFTMISLFIRKTVRPIYRKYVVPLKDLPEKLEVIHEQQVELGEQIGAVDGKVDEQGRQLGRFEVGMEFSREQAADAVNIARAVQRAVGARARGDEDDDQ